MGLSGFEVGVDVDVGDWPPWLTSTFLILSGSSFWQEEISIVAAMRKSIVNSFFIVVKD